MKCGSSGIYKKNRNWIKVRQDGTRYAETLVRHRECLMFRGGMLALEAVRNS